MARDQLPPTAPPGVIDYLDERDPEADEFWRHLLNGKLDEERMPALMRSVFRHLPSEPRCKWCYAPYGAPFGAVTSRIGYGRWEKNPTLCARCMHYMEEKQGGAEVDLAVMFADLRGSTEIAAGMKPGEYTRLLNTYYGIAAGAVQGRGGIVDKYLGDGVLALFLRGLSDDPARAAVEAGRHILEEVADHRDLPAALRPLPVGVGIHYGEAYVGIVGQAGQPTNFTALGDAVNVTERISSSAGPGELLLSDALVDQLGGSVPGAQERELTLKGVAEPVLAWSLRFPAAVGG
jgi:adenylate cyclase